MKNPTSDEATLQEIRGTGLCPEAQADGVPCVVCGRDCTECGRADGWETERPGLELPDLLRAGL